MRVWPSELTTSVLAGTHNMTPIPNVVVFKPEVGGAIRRRRYTGRLSQESFELILTYADVKRLQEFWAHECQQGSLCFYGDLVDGVTRKWWFSPESPPQFVNVPGGDAYRVSLSMECER